MKWNCNMTRTHSQYQVFCKSYGNANDSQISYDLAVERNFCDCVWKPEKFRTSMGFEAVTSRYRCDTLTNWAVKPLIPHGLIRTHKWPAPIVSGFIAQLVRTSHRYHEVTGSNPVEVLNFSGFYTQWKKLHSTARIIAHLISHPQFDI